MSSQRLTSEQVEIFIEKLKNGFSWSNGLVGHTRYYYKDGEFLTASKDMREPESIPYVHSYAEDEFREMMRKRSFVEWAHKSLIRRLES